MLKKVLNVIVLSGLAVFYSFVQYLIMFALDGIPAPNPLLYSL